MSLVSNLQSFESYLQEKHYRSSTINGFIQNAGHFLQWAAGRGITAPEQVGYNDLLSYVQDEQAKGLSVQTINVKLGSIKHYYAWLQSEGSVTKNPAATLRIRGKAKTVIQQPLSYGELQDLYARYKSLDKTSLREYTYPLPGHIRERAALTHQRNVVILGLMIWQGVHSGELAQLETGHINLDAGTIYIPSTSRSNSRELSLSTQQILTLHSYLHGGIRDQFRPGTGKLIAGDLHNIVSLLLAALKGINPQIRNAQHIRASVILHWLRQHNKRQVQYMAGHKCISSTEVYEVQELETLTDQLQQHHPFG